MSTTGPRIKLSKKIGGNDWMEGVKRAEKLSPPQFRRSGPSTLGNLAVAAFVGTLSGYYIFGIPLQQHWEEQYRNAATASSSTEPVVKDNH